MESTPLGRGKPVSDQSGSFAGESDVASTPPTSAGAAHPARIRPDLPEPRRREISPSPQHASTTTVFRSGGDSGAHIAAISGHEACIADDAVLKRYADLARVAETPADIVTKHKRLLFPLGKWLYRYDPEAGGLAHLVQADQAVVDRLISEYCDAVGAMRPARQSISAAVAALRDEVPLSAHFELSAEDQAVLDRYERAARDIGVPERTMKNHKFILCAFGQWLKEQRPQTKGLSGVEQADREEVRQLIDTYCDTLGPDSHYSERLIGAVNVLRNETASTGEVHESDEAVLDRYRLVTLDAGVLTASTVREHRRRLRDFGLWLAQRQTDAGGLAGIVRADPADVNNLIGEYRNEIGPDTTDGQRINAAVNSLRSEAVWLARLEVYAENQAVLDRYTRAARDAHVLSDDTVSNHNGCLRVFGFWLVQHHLKVGGLAGIVRADPADVEKLVAEFRKEIEPKSYLWRQINGAVNALRTGGVPSTRPQATEEDQTVLDRFARAARDADALTVPSVNNYNRYLRGFGLWLAQRHPEAGGLAGIVRMDPADVKDLVMEFRDQIGRGSSLWAQINGAVNALRTYRDVSETDRPVLDRYRQAAREARVPEGTVKNNLNCLRAFSVWLDDHHPQDRGLAGIKSADQETVDLRVSAYRDSLDAKSVHRLLISNAVKALRDTLAPPSPETSRR